jgi:hypothetical protein
MLKNIILCLKDDGSMLMEIATFVGELDTAGGSGKKRSAQLLFQTMDIFADALLCEQQIFGGF